ncbi:FecR family protein [Parapedobacter sp. 10938]|uniref:FecR family protein n=1 Tax=Parapedobacter flavus TaxID=3110225 RepID=UPI002DBD2921|nr:FecR family protein [Parapedobacter sp. 10938]MEC3879322.1 FecR family protein [Parapedobacter sp. 10938]
MPRNMVLPVAEFASTIRYGEAGVTPVAAGQEGPIARVGNLDVVRNAAGTLVVSEVREATAADTVGHPSLHFVTAPFQQCEVLLPGGTRVRLNAGSELNYPLLLPGPDVCYVRIEGEAQVSVPAGAAARVVVETVNSQVQAVQGEFAMLATAAETRVTLLDGALSVISKQQREHRLVEQRGGQATVRWVHELNGTLTESLYYRKTGNAEEAIGWTKASRRYREASLREYVADVSRWYGIKVKDIHCIPASMRVDAMICYRAPLGEALAIVVKAGLQVNRYKGMYSFCDSDDMFRPVMANRTR